MQKVAVKMQITGEVIAQRTATKNLKILSKTFQKGIDKEEEMCYTT